ncbi:UDP-N-acetylmuramate dehydrogenase [Helicobacter cholecystus]|uniref:UDP-N-acetylmuramate dehydrogenase n=1 Tax=Helicobacter cholecystus TaxID=45498 RepID=UPI002738A081|nr:UDP-N-acetylmuramate dehydrogenase [Helicobacter cholecystus]
MLKKSIDFCKYTSLKIGGILEVEFLNEPRALNDREKILGAGNNILVSPDASDLYILGKEFDYILDLGELIEIGGAVSSGRIYSYFKKNNLFGLEFLRGLPGSLGGLIKMNAGMKNYEIKQILQSVCIDGEWVESKKLNFAYRHSGIDGVIYGARFFKIEGFRSELISVFEMMRNSHPHLPSCGSCFKNPNGDFAGRLLESVGMKGFRVGGVGLSEKHANFLVNLGGGRFEEALGVIFEAKRRVREERGIELECEVKIIT